MQKIKISNKFHNFLEVVEKRFIKDERWDRSYELHADPIFFTSITFLKMLLENNQRLDTPSKALVFNDQVNITAKNNFFIFLIFN